MFFQYSLCKKSSFSSSTLALLLLVLMHCRGPSFGFFGFPPGSKKSSKPDRKNNNLDGLFFDPGATLFSFRLILWMAMVSSHDRGRSRVWKIQNQCIYTCFLSHKITTAETFFAFAPIPIYWMPSFLIKIKLKFITYISFSKLTRSESTHQLFMFFGFLLFPCPTPAEQGDCNAPIHLLFLT